MKALKSKFWEGRSRDIKPTPAALALQSKLWDGVDGCDIKLTHAEWNILEIDGAGIKPNRDVCKVLLEVFLKQAQKGKRGPKTDLEAHAFRPKAIATLRALYEIKGKARKAAVDLVMQQYGVNRQEVFEACRAFPNARAEAEGMQHWPGLQWWITHYEREWAAPKRRRERRRSVVSSANNSPK